jgi:hypothetical protein
MKEVTLCVIEARGTGAARVYSAGSAPLPTEGTCFSLSPAFRGGVTAVVEPDPGPRPRVVDEAALGRVRRDVVPGLLELLVADDRARRVAVAEDVPVPVVADIEALGVATIEPLHEDVEVCVRALEQEVVVDDHQAIRPATDAVAGFEPAKEVDEAVSVCIVHEQREIAERSSGDVEGAVGEHAPWPGHPRRRWRCRAKAAEIDTDSSHVSGPGTG